MRQRPLSAAPGTSSTSTFPSGPWIYFLLFALSGFAGLIYESIWSHYLKLFLGHAAYAQTLVLALFMGGMALGSWLAGKWGLRWRNLLVGYAIIELVIGVLGIVFHELFTTVTSFAFEVLIPGIGQPALVDVSKWLLAAALIFPQTILLGMTFPLMSAGVIRRFPEDKGKTIASLYFTNSIGAAMGVLASGFYMVNAFGLPGTVMIAGVLNIALAILVLALSLKHNVAAEEKSTATATGEVQAFPMIFFMAAFITGVASFIYEIGWIRMLSMVLGSSTHSFELMLSAFILGLALGSLWIRGRIDRIGDPIAFAGRVQILMGIMALATLVFYNQSYDLMAGIIQSLSRSDSAYQAFLVGGYLISTLIMLPATFFAGMTLPLFTSVLIRSNYGERAIGNVYAANTIGAIVGVFFAVHIGFELLGLKGLIIFGALLDIGLGLFILARTKRIRWLGEFAPFAAASLLAVAGVMLFVQFDPNRLASSVYRNGSVQLTGRTIPFMADGKTATIAVSVTTDGTRANISTNGKSDAALVIKGEGRTSDEATMVLAGALPLILNPSATKIANIGFGSGLTTHTVLASTQVESVDTIEIERQILEGARHFGHRVARAYEDDRSHFYIEDAKTYFARNQKKYDVIISEPSNPWVSGTATLFSKEFYAHVKHYLEDDGLFIQWIQLYEINIDLVFSILSALNDEFSDYHMYYAGPADLLLVARQKGSVPSLTESTFNSMDTSLRDELLKYNLRNHNDLLIRWVGDKALYQPLLPKGKFATNSDYYPVVEQNAPKLRFQRHSANEISDLRMQWLPIIDALRPDSSIQDYAQVTAESKKNQRHAANINQLMKSRLSIDGVGDKINADELKIMTPLLSLKQLAGHCPTVSDGAHWVYMASNIVVSAFPNLGIEQRQNLIRHAKPACQGEGRKEMDLWYPLYMALASHDWSGVLNAGAAVMKNSSIDLRVLDRQIIVGSTFLAQTVLGQHAEALKFWNEAGEKFYNAPRLPLEMKLLLALNQSKVNAEKANQN